MNLQKIIFSTLKSLKPTEFVSFLNSLMASQAPAFHFICLSRNSPMDFFFFLDKKQRNCWKEDLLECSSFPSMGKIVRPGHCRKSPSSPLKLNLLSLVWLMRSYVKSERGEFRVFTHSNSRHEVLRHVPSFLSIVPI